MTSAAVPVTSTGCPSGYAPPTSNTPTNLAAFVETAGGVRTLNLSVRGAKCGGCLSKIETALLSLPGVDQARLNLSTGLLKISSQGTLPANKIGETLSDLGYGVSAYNTEDQDSNAKREERRLLLAMAIAGFATANIMLLSISVWGGHGEMGEATRQGFHILSGIIALPVMLFSGQVFFQSAYKVLSKGRANMDVPISLALILAYGVSVWTTLSGAEHAYFDACVMLLFFLLIGRFLDARLRRRAFAAAGQLAALQNRSVNRILADGKLEAVPAAAIHPGDTVLLAAGERASVDLRLTAQMPVSVDESMVTGENLPRTLSAGDTVYAGTVNIGAPFEAEAISKADSSLLADISQMLDMGEQRRSHYRKLADKAVALYVPFVHSAAALTFLAWLFLGFGVERAVMVAVTTLIITCPCALALAAPVTQVVASARLFQQGVYLRSGDALERLAEVNHIVFDKTGTLTLGTPKLSGSPSELDAAARLARASRHPLSQAIVNAAGPGHVAPNVTERPGAGLRADIDGVEHKLGSAEWVKHTAPTTCNGPHLYYRQADLPPVRFDFEDELRGDAAEAIENLRGLGISAEILSGDNANAVATTANRLGVSKWTAAVSPTGKVAYLETLRQSGKRTLMIGDGLNDAAALSLAHASLAPGSAMDVSQSAADAVFTQGLSSIAMTVQNARRARSTMRQNFGLAAGYNLIAVPIAVLGFVTPLIAAVAMSASSLIVTLNALRMRRS